MLERDYWIQENQRSRDFIPIDRWRVQYILNLLIIYTYQILPQAVKPRVIEE